MKVNRTPHPRPFSTRGEGRRNLTPDPSPKERGAGMYCISPLSLGEGLGVRSIAALVLIVIFTSCTSSKKIKHQETTKIDSTSQSSTITHQLHADDKITTRKIEFTANKFTEITYARDTTLRDTVIYIPHYRIAEQVQQNTRDSITQRTRDTIYIAAKSSTNVKKQTKIKDKEKQHKGISLWWILLLIPIFIVINYKKVKKYFP